MGSVFGFAEAFNLMVLLNVPGISCTLEIDIQIADNLGLKLITYQRHVLVNCLSVYWPSYIRITNVETCRLQTNSLSLGISMDRLYDTDTTYLTLY